MSFILCQRDSYLKQFETKVLKCIQNLGSKTEGISFPKNRKFKSGDGFFVLLDETILFAEGGGQPSDSGSLNGIKVLDVFRDEKDNKIVYHHVEKEFKVEETVKIELDFEKRYDNMQQHTGQHLISAVAKKLFNANTTSWNLSDNYNYCLIDFDLKELRNEELQKLEEAVNEQIRQSKQVKYLEFDTNNTNTKLPENLSSRNLDKNIKVIRVVEIEGLDMNTCCGTHLKNLSELQLIKFPLLEKNKGCVRLNFVAGQRTAITFTKSIDREKKLTKLFSTTPDKAIEYASKLQVEKQDLAKENKNLIKDLAVFIGENLSKRFKKKKRSINQ